MRDVDLLWPVLKCSRSLSALSAFPRAPTGRASISSRRRLRFGSFEQVAMRQPGPYSGHDP
jgi:hypothetical protein